MPSIRLTANLQIQLTDDASNAQVPLSFLTQYSQKAMLDLTFSGTQSDLLIADGTIATPALILALCYQGTIDLKFNNGNAAGTGLIRLNMDVTPTPTSPAFFLYRTNAPSAASIYASTPGPAVGRIWLFQ